MDERLNEWAHETRKKVNEIIYGDKQERVSLLKDEIREDMAQMGLTITSAISDMYTDMYSDINGKFVLIDKRFDVLEACLTELIVLNKQTNQKISAVIDRIDNHEGRISHLEHHIQ